jgi:hypothetical protein
MKLRLAELNVEIINNEKHIEGLAKEYIADFDKADITIVPTKEDIEKELGRTSARISTGYAESNAAYRILGNLLPNFDGFILHAATVEIQGRGICFLGTSGTGKSTHMLGWRKLFGNRLRVINGDKPIVRVKNGKPFVYGTPWCGKEGLNENRSAILTDLCFIVRGDENKVTKANSDDLIKRLMNQIVVPMGSSNILKTFELIDSTLKNCNLWEIQCNTDLSAAEISSKIILR